MSYSSKFFRLQQIDTQLDHIHTRLKELEILLGENAALQAAEAQHNETDARLQTNRKILRQAEDQVQDQRVKISQNESSLYGGKIRNPKELQDLQNEVASLKKYLVVLEDRQLESMLATEEAENALTSAKSELDQVRASVVEQQAHLLAERTSLTQNTERFEIERQAAEAALVPAEIDIYNQLRKIRNGVAVVKISERSCSACGVNLTPAVIQSASSPSQIARCTSCGRILFPG